MKKQGLAVIRYLVLIVLSIILVYSTRIYISEAAEKTGEQLFNEYCSMCHPDGGNIISPNKTLSMKDRKANNINTSEGIIRIMRKPGPGMTAFDAKSLSDNEAQKIADYIMKQYSK